ncbi:MAG: Ig-like domain-containing protein, partial [Bacilli bacterium]
TANQSVTYSGFDETVVSVSATGLVTALKTGTTNITVTTVGKDASDAALTKTVAVTINQFAAGTDATIADLAAGTNVEEGKLYNVTGVLEGLDKTNKYGNSYLTDVTSGKSVYCYGLTTTASAFAYENSAYKYTNVKDSVTSLADYNNGDVITVKCVYAPFNGANQISAVALTRTADTATKYAITKEATENGSFVVDKETAAYGEAVTVTPTAAEGYEVGLVSLETGFGTTAIKAVDSVYSFTATVVNKVSVTFKKTVASTKVASYNLVGTSTSGATEADVVSQFTAGADTTTAGLSNIVTSVSGLTNAYLGYNGYQNLGLKFGNSKKTGTITIGLSSNVIKAVVKTTGWTATDTLQVGDAAAQIPGVAYNAENAEQTLTFDFTSTNSLSFTYDKRGFISSIELYALVA